MAKIKYCKCGRLCNTQGICPRCRQWEGFWQDIANERALQGKLKLAQSALDEVKRLRSNYEKVEQ